MPPMISPYPVASLQAQHPQSNYMNAAQNWGNTQQSLSGQNVAKIGSGGGEAHSQANSQNSNEGNSSGSDHRRKYV